MALSKNKKVWMYALGGWVVGSFFGLNNVLGGLKSVTGGKL